MSVPMIAEKPADAVRDRTTVPAGWTVADEFATPSSLIFSRVSVTYSIRSSRIRATSPVVTHGMEQSNHHSGCSRLGVCPDPSFATSLSFATRQLSGYDLSHGRAPVT